jgi:molybdopterin synthase catalytic subunit
LGTTVLERLQFSLEQPVIHSKVSMSTVLDMYWGHNSSVITGKVVTRLEYQAYSKLAVKTMGDIIRSAYESVESLIHCAVHHRLGTVPVGEASIVIAVSSRHRKESFVACELILEEVK